MKISEGTDGARPGNGCESYGRKSADVELAVWLGWQRACWAPQSLEFNPSQPHKVRYSDTCLQFQTRWGRNRRNRSSKSSQLHSKFETILDYVRSCHRREKRKKGRKKRREGKRERGRERGNKEGSRQTENFSTWLRCAQWGGKAGNFWRWTELWKQPGLSILGVEGWDSFLLPSKRGSGEVSKWLHFAFAAISTSTLCLVSCLSERTCLHFPQIQMETNQCLLSAEEPRWEDHPGCSMLFLKKWEVYFPQLSPTEHHCDTIRLLGRTDLWHAARYSALLGIYSAH